MADIPSNIEKMNDIEIASDQPLTEALMNKIGANINGLIDLFGKSQTFETSGNFLVPENVTRLFVLACGGGGGGGAGEQVGGSGGAGSNPQLLFLKVTPLTNINVMIGAGGAGGLASGSIKGGLNGSPTELLINGFTYSFSGGGGGFASGTYLGPLPPVSGAAGVFNHLVQTTAGGQGSGVSGGMATIQAGAGARSHYALGGAAGVTPTNQSFFAGGGGGAGFGSGGNGASSLGSSGGNGLLGGGGGGGAGGWGIVAGNGGNGGSGLVIFIW